MKKILLSLLMVLGFAIFSYASEQNIDFAGLQIWVPDEWEVDNSDNVFSAIYSDQYFFSVTCWAVDGYESLSEAFGEINNILADKDYADFESKYEDITNMDDMETYFAQGTANVGSIGDMLLQVYFIDTSDGISVLVLSGSEESWDALNETAENIIGSVRRLED